MKYSPTGMLPTVAATIIAFSLKAASGAEGGGKDNEANDRPSPSLFQNSSEEGSSGAIRTIIACMVAFELLFHASRLAIRKVLDTHPEYVLDPSLLSKDGDDNKDEKARWQGDETAKTNLIERGPSYVVSLIHSICVSIRGVHHIYGFWGVSNLDKLLLLPSSSPLGRAQSLHVAKTNLLFVSYLLYDLCHIMGVYPKLGGVDTLLHHGLFATCSIINGTYGIMAFPFGWLIIGEFSTIFLNFRWFFHKCGYAHVQAAPRTQTLIHRNNVLFSITFFLTRILAYSCGIIHLFASSRGELKQLMPRSGVPPLCFYLTLGCIVLGWGLNCIWMIKIVSMVLNTTDGKNNKKEK